MYLNLNFADLCCFLTVFLISVFMASTCAVPFSLWDRIFWILFSTINSKIKECHFGWSKRLPGMFLLDLSIFIRGVRSFTLTLNLRISWSRWRLMRSCNLLSNLKIIRSNLWVWSISRTSMLLRTLKIKRNLKRKSRKRKKFWSNKMRSRDKNLEKRKENWVNLKVKMWSLHQLLNRNPLFLK